MSRNPFGGGLITVRRPVGCIFFHHARNEKGNGGDMFARWIYQDGCFFQRPGQMPGQDPRTMSLTGLPRVRNEYEYQQQIMLMMQQNSIDPRSRSQMTPQLIPRPISQLIRQEEKASSRNKLSAVFKTFGKSHSNNDQSKTPPKSTVSRTVSEKHSFKK